MTDTGDGTPADRPRARLFAPDDPSNDPVERLIESEPNPFGYSDTQRHIGDAGTPITASGPLDEGEADHAIPPNPLWAMKVHRHFQWSHLLPHDERHDRVRVAVGRGDDIAYLMDDGHHHRIVGRTVGRTRDGAGYALVARIPIAVSEELQAGRLSGADAFSSGRGLALYGIVEDGPASNVFIVTTYRDADELPAEYLPPHPPIEFAQDLDPTV